MMKHMGMGHGMMVGNGSGMMKGMGPGMMHGDPGRRLRRSGRIDALKAELHHAGSGTGLDQIRQGGPGRRSRDEDGP